MKKEELDPTKDTKARMETFSMFKWEGSHSCSFAIDINNSFKVKLTPKDESPVYTQSLPVPINLKEDLTVELALMHRCDITLLFSKNVSPIFAQRKPNGILRQLVDLRKTNALDLR